MFLLQTWPFALFPQQPGPEPWISRTTASSSRGNRVPNAGPPPSSGASSNASSSPDDNLVLQDDDGHHDEEEHQLPQGDSCRRLSGGRLLGLQHVYQPPAHQCHPYLQRYVDG